MEKTGKVPSSTKRISSIFMIITLIMLALALASLFQVVEDIRGGKLNLANIAISLSAVAISSYMLFQLRVKPLKLGFETQEVLTTIQCQKCDYSNTRDFQKGDFIYKPAETCPKCNEATLISSIYRKPDEKEKKQKRS